MGIIIGNNLEKDGITLEEALDAVGANKRLNGVGVRKVCLIEDINKMHVRLLSDAGKKPTPLTPQDFDVLYDMSISGLEDVTHDFNRALAERRFSKL